MTRKYGQTKRALCGMIRLRFGRRIVDAKIIDENNTFSLVAYIDDDELIKKLTSKDNATVFVGAAISGSYLSYSSHNLTVISNILNYIYCTDPATKPGGSYKHANQDVIEATLKNVDRKNGLEGEKLNAALFGDSG